VISVSEVSVTYGKLTAVAEVSFTVPPGFVLAVSGPSGAGKSSLLWAIAGAVPLANGKVEIDGLVIADRPMAAANGVVLIPQGNGLARVLTARENLSVPLLADHKPLDELDQAVEDALTLVGLADSGEQQRVAVARGIAQQGKVILADESTSELDSSNRERVLELLRAEADRGAAVVIATHDPTVAESADGHALMDEGRLSWLRRL
jgi:putative ABC transport system ATP-binding protein